MNNNFMRLLTDVVVLFPAFLAVFTVRGFFSAWVAKKMGDDTAYRDGFVSLNPLMHINVLGLGIILLVVFLIGGLLPGTTPRSALYMILLFVGVRWTYDVPFEPGNFKSLKWGAIATLFAGSLGCFLLAFLFLYVAKYVPFLFISTAVVKSLFDISTTIVNLALYFGVLELLPIPPFSGGRILQFLLPYSKQGFLAWLEEYSFFIILGLFFLPVVSDFFFFSIGLVAFLVKSFLLLFVF